MAKRIRRGKKIMPKGKAWRLEAPGGRRKFKATLHAKWKSLGHWYVIFRIIKRKSLNPSRNPSAKPSLKPIRVSNSS